MGSNKKCNAIVQSVYMGDGVRLYYEKINMTPNTGTDTSTYSLLLDLMALKWQELKTQAVDKVQSIVRREPEWPPHSLMCDCGKCQKHATGYMKTLRSKS